MPTYFVPPSKEGADEALARAQRIAEGLYPHQVEGVAFLLGRRKAILADDMGLGKTRQAIVAMREAAPGGPYLVVCPASVKRNWAREIHIVDPSIAVHVMGDPDYAHPAPEWTIINYDILSKHFEHLQKTKWQGFVFDEAHYLKNRNAKRSKLSTALAATGERDTGAIVYALTGTPITNRPRDLFPLLQLLAHPMGKSFIAFAKRYCDAYRNDYGWVTDGASNLDELVVQLRGAFLRRSKDEVLDLPPKIRTWLPVQVKPGLAAREISEIVLLLLKGEGRPRDKVHLLALLTRAREMVAMAKASQTIELIESAIEQDEKVIVFSCFSNPIHRIHKHFGDAAVLLTGETPGRERQDVVDRFQNDDSVRVFAANIIAGGIGINLTAARQVIFNDLDWVPANHWQAEDRAYRIGQTNTVNVTYMVAEGTVDDFVATLLETKSRLFDAVMGGGDAAISRDVLSELEEALGSLIPNIADDTRDLDANELLQRAAALVRARHPISDSPAERPGIPPEALERAIQLLAASLRGPQVRKFRVPSTTQPGVTYEITVDGTDVICNCPGFENRGMCKHARQFLNEGRA
jgi:SWI/SNF-related matrix-associated actin-dependent regulator 1 of chromatin subfamily A